MIVRTSKNPPPTAPLERSKARVLIIESPYYKDVAEELVRGAIAEIEAWGASYDRITVPGALEIPQALNLALDTGVIAKGDPRQRFDGAVALGCVIRGETSHYDIVCNNANHWLYETAIRGRIPIGNGILTVDTMDQALARARGGRQGKGGDAARACLRLIELAGSFAASFEEQSV